MGAGRLGGLKGFLPAAGGAAAVGGAGAGATAAGCAIWVCQAGWAGGTPALPKPIIPGTPGMPIPPLGMPMPFPGTRPPIPPAAPIPLGITPGMPIPLRAGIMPITPPPVGHHAHSAPKPRVLHG